MPEELKTLNTYSKHTYRVVNEPYKILGIIDWRYAFAAAVPSVFFGLMAHSKVAGIIMLCLLAWKSYDLSENDPNLPLAWWVSLRDKRRLCAFHKEKT